MGSDQSNCWSYSNMRCLLEGTHGRLGNTDGSVKGPSGEARCGGLLRDETGFPKNI